jgi:Pilus biogenesis CpaD protein (pilus_cpaD)
MSKFTVISKATLLLFLAVPVTGCAIDSFEEDQAMQPYGGSKLHPIKVANGKATVEGCGDWSENVMHTSSNEMMANHGCAVQANIAAMAAYPEDLAGGNRRLPPSLGDWQYGAIRKVTLKSDGSAPAAATTPPPAVPKD